MLVHLRVVPGLWTAAEERRHPELRSQSIVLGGLPHERGVVREANLVAQERGVQSGMSLSDAYRVCPEGLFLTPDLPYYASAWSDILEVLDRFTPMVEPVEMGQAVCDLTGCERHFSDFRTGARAIAAAVWHECGIVSRLGIATNRLTAQLASWQVDADGVCLVEQGRERAFLVDLPITALPGVDDRLALLFQILGIRTVGTLAALSTAAVRQRFGAAGEQLHTFARGIDPRPVVPPPPRPAIAARQVCDDGSFEEAVAALTQLATVCAGELEKRGLAGRVIELTLIWRREGDRRMGILPLPDTGWPAPDTGWPAPDTGWPAPDTGWPAAHPADLPQHLPLEAIPTPSSARGNASDEWSELPVAYRIHSMLPQPGILSDRRRTAPPASVSVPRFAAPTLPEREPRTHVRAVARVPVSSAGSVEDRARSLLLQHWPRDAGRRLYALELEITEFERPMQLGFAELNRLGETGALAGLSAGRVQILMQQEEVLAARYGDASFRHLEGLDPTNLLADRRFRWVPGLLATTPGGGTRVPETGRRLQPAGRRLKPAGRPAITSRKRTKRR